MNTQVLPWILGVNFSHHGSMCLLKGDQIIVAIQEERLTREKRGFLKSPEPLSLNYCLEYAGISKSDLDVVVGSSCLSQKTIAEWLKAMFPGTPILTMNHHLSHAVGAFATSGFSEAAILVVDGSGSPSDELIAEELSVVKQSILPDNFQKPERYETVSLYQASGTKVINLEKHIGHGAARTNSKVLGFGSFGSMFKAAAKLIFSDIHDVGKVMGLAPYGKPKIRASEFFDVIDGRFVFYDAISKYFPLSEPWPAHQSDHETLAASVQNALEEALLYLVGHLKKLCPSDNVVFSGGVALNSVANDKILIRGGEFQNVYIMPPAEDSGNAIGAAYYGLWQLTKENTKPKLVHDALGRAYKLSEIDKAIAETPAVKVYESEDAIATVANLLTEGKIVGWFQGRSELGPRALGQRSILCDPRRPEGKAYLNNQVKHRESFRPFAPIVLLEEANNWFELEGVDADSPFMLRVCQFREEKKDLVPAVVHVDGTGRLQTVTKARNDKLYDLVQAFFERTGVPIILNTSFNVMGEPIVETPDDALWCLLYTGVDYCILEDRIVTKAKNYNSILDLYPYVTASNHRLATNIENKYPSYELGYNEFENADISFSVRNQWGNFELSGRAEWLSLLELIDGRTTGWKLLEKINLNNQKINQFSFIKLLGHLRRRSILKFSSEV